MHRRSRTLNIFKIALPLGAALLLGLILVWPLIYPTEPSFVLSFEDVTEYDDKVRIVKPRYAGRDSADRQYVVTAALATQRRAGDEEVRLENIVADVTLANGNWMSVESELGVYWPQKGLLELNGGVNLFTDKGIELHVQSARIDLDRGVASSDARLFGHNVFGTVEAGGFRAGIDEETVQFGDGVKMRIFPNAGSNS